MNTPLSFTAASRQQRLQTTYRDRKRTRGPGPYEVASIARTAAQTGAGIAAGTIYYPVDVTGTVGAVAILPGVDQHQSAVAWYGPLLASHGFVAMTMNTNSAFFDFPAQRATRFLLTLDYLVSSNNPVQHLVDPDRLAVMGYSMGGGGAQNDHGCSRIARTPALQQPVSSDR